MNNITHITSALFTAGVLAISSNCKALTIYDAAADFSTNSNPNGVWSYGYSTTLGSAMTLYSDNADAIAGMGQWRSNIWAGAPAVWKNFTTNTITYNTDIYGPGQLGFHPGPNGEYSIVRFTAPTANQYQIAGAFYGEDTAGTTTDVHILENNVSIFNGYVNGFGPSSGPTFNVNLALNAGDHLDFTVGVGGNGLLNDATVLSAQLTVVPEPMEVTLLMLSIGCVLPFRCFRQRARR
jgi:hypothetical protein